MGSVRKIGKEYVIEFLARGLKYQQKAGPDKGKAEELLRSIEEKIAKGEMALTSRDVDYDVFFHDFLENLPAEFPPKTIARFQKVVRHFECFLKSDCKDTVLLSQITPKVMEHYRSFILKGTGKHPVWAKPRAVNLALFLLRHVFDCAIKAGYLNDNPLLHIRFASDPAAKKPLTIELQNLDTLLRALPGCLSYAVRFSLLTGIDIRELCELQWEDVDFKTRVIAIHRNSKPASGLLGRTIPLLHEAAGLLQEVRAAQKSRTPFVFAGSHGAKSSPSALISSLRYAAGRKGKKTIISFACLRHTFARELVQRGVTLVSLQRILGHDDIAKTLIYSPFFFENSFSENYRATV